jgi:hypothetical protein
MCLAGSSSAREHGAAAAALLCLHIINLLDMLRAALSEGDRDYDDYYDDEEK